MTQHTLNKLPNETYEIAVTLPWADIQQEKETTFESLLKNFEFQGYRKGKVPKEIARQHIKDETIYRELLNKMLPKVYQDIVSSEGLKPIVSPKVELVEAKDGMDWKITIRTAGEPTVELGDYRKIIADVNGEFKKDDLWVPGKDEKPDDKEASAKKQKKLSAILDAILKQTPVGISDMIIESEVESRLAHLLDEIQKIGLTVEAYLKSKNTTMDALKEQLKQEVTDSYKLEFILMAIADAEKITVEKAELDKLFGGLKDENERSTVAQNAYMYASILRKQKTLDFLVDL